VSATLDKIGAFVASRDDAQRLADAAKASRVAPDGAAAARATGMKPSEIRSVRDTRRGVKVVTVDGTALSIVPPDRPDRFGRSGLMLAAWPPSWTDLNRSHSSMAVYDELPHGETPSPELPDPIETNEDARVAVLPPSAPQLPTGATVEWWVNVAGWAREMLAVDNEFEQRRVHAKYIPLVPQIQSWQVTGQMLVSELRGAESWLRSHGLDGYGEPLDEGASSR
jgi:hypothetical protein